jgi:DNA invertase Pin-like site-specific DNA recombinase/ssDNA-binding Zn-finger/Zn-ribbon topoisomerase 1
MVVSTILLRKESMNYLGQKTYIAALYARLSSEDLQEGTSVSIETQKKILEDYCKSNGIIIYNVYVDDGYPGTNFNRPAFKRLLRDCENKQFNMVVVKDLSRLGREHIETDNYIEKYFPERNIRFVAIGDDYDSESKMQDLDFIVPMRNLFNQFYPADTSKKVRQAFRAKASRGEFIGAQAPFGYRKSDKDKHVLIIDEEVAPIVQRMFGLIAYHGYGFTKVAKLLSSEKILTPSAYQAQNSNREYSKNPYDWNLGSVRAIINNETYLGKLVSGKRSVMSFKNKRVIKKDREDWIVVDNMFPPIITQELWDDAHARIGERKRDTTSSFDNIFAGLIRCDKCGKVLGLSSNKREKPYYVCETYKKKGKHICTPHYTLYNDIYDTVLQKIQEVVGVIQSDEFETQVAEEIFSEMGQENNIGEQIKQTQSQIAKINNRYEQMYQDRLDGIISVERFKQMVKGDEEKLSVLKQKLDTLLEKEKSQNSAETAKLAFIQKVKDLGKITSLDRVILNTLIDKIVISNREMVDGEYTQNIIIHFKFSNFSN